MSLREVWTWRAAVRQRRERERRTRLTHAWEIAALAAQAVWGKLPPLAKLLRESEPPAPRQTPAQVRFLMEQLAARLGTPIETIPWPTKPN